MVCQNMMSSAFSESDLSEIYSGKARNLDMSVVRRVCMAADVAYLALIDIVVNAPFHNTLVGDLHGPS